MALTTDSRISMSNVRVVGPRIEVAEAKALVDADEAQNLEGIHQYFSLQR